MRALATFCLRKSSYSFQRLTRAWNSLPHGPPTMGRSLCSQEAFFKPLHKAAGKVYIAHRLFPHIRHRKNQTLEQHSQPGVLACRVLHETIRKSMVPVSLRLPHPLSGRMVSGRQFPGGVLEPYRQQVRVLHSKYILKGDNSPEILPFVQHPLHQLWETP